MFLQMTFVSFMKIFKYLLLNGPKCGHFDMNSSGNVDMNMFFNLNRFNINNIKDTYVCVFVFLAV